MFQRILMVCTGNICRSPYAEAVLQLSRQDLTVTSAGLAAMVDLGMADETALAVALERDTDLSNHVPRQVNSRIVASADLILVMDDPQLHKLLQKYPEARGKSFKIAKWRGDKDITDPYMRSEDFFRLVFNEIDAAVESWLPHVANRDH